MARAPSAAAGLALLLLAACGDATGPGAAPDVIDALPRALSVAETEVVARSNDFGFELLREVYGAETASPNVFLSPFSASMALGMTLNGAAGSTFDGMRTALGLEGLEQEAINRSYRDLTQLLLGLDPAVELGIANSTWARSGFPFRAAFFEAVRTWFDAEARELDFGDPRAKDAVNGWACEKTRRRICEVLDGISPAHVLFLLNAVYFQGDWTQQFDAGRTRAEPFHREDGTVVRVPRMKGRPNIGLAWRDGVVLAELPYGGRAWVMTVALPPEGRTLGELVADLDGETWQRWTGALGEYMAWDVELPRLELSYESHLNDALASMGMGDAFVPGRADFSRLTPASVHIDYVKQNTFLKVDEEGTEAAAVTTVAIAESAGPPPAFVVDRPFLLAIRERLSGTILFLGAIGDPGAG